jgi:hypothetical protein
MAVPVVQTSIDTGDGAITATRAKVYGILVAAGATGGVWELDDGTDATGTTMISGFAQASSQVFIPLGDTPIDFKTAIFADIGGTNVTVTTLFTA